MKLRIRNNSIRLRLTRSEVGRFGVERSIIAETDFGNNALKYGMQWDDDAKELKASMSDNLILLHIPTSIAIEFVSTEKIGIQHTSILENGKNLFILIEKDFKCIDGNVLEDETDNYENPLATCKQ